MKLLPVAAFGYTMPCQSEKLHHVGECWSRNAAKLGMMMPVAHIVLS